jgi:pantothenate synthetase
LPAVALEEELKERMSREPGVRVDYLALVHPETLEREDTAKRGVHLIMAAWVGSTRLIDNGRL